MLLQKAQLYFVIFFSKMHNMHCVILATQGLLVYTMKPNVKVTQNAFCLHKKHY